MSRTSRSRRSLSTTVGVALSATALVAIGGSGVAQAGVDSVAAPAPLRIMLTNDDGYNAPGITAVRTALSAAGYDVTVVAPATNQSGTGARATFGGPMTVTHPDDKAYAVAGSPADSVEFGLSVVFADKAPDLVISGTNAGQNVGAATVHSGTVGAAVTAMNDGVPAIAISTEINFATGEAPYADTAAFLVRYLTTLKSITPQGGLVPKGTGLNINYPVVPAGVTPPIALTRNGRGFLDLTYSGAELPAVGATSTYSIGVSLAVTETEKNADTTALAADQISIAPIEADYDADSARADALVRQVARRLG